MKKYEGMIPPCGIFCGACPQYEKLKSPCLGAENHCVKRKYKGIYICCIEKKDLKFCFECKSYPCSRFKQFATTWKKYGQDLIQNQESIKRMVERKFLESFNRARKL